MEKTSKPHQTKYDSYVKPHLKKIRKWYNGGANIAEIATNLGIHKNTFYKMRHQVPELSKIFDNPDFSGLIKDLRGALVKKALGFKETVTKRTSLTSQNGNVSKVELIEQYFPPDVAAINLALKNYDTKNWANDPAELAIKKRLVKLQEEKQRNETPNTNPQIKGSNEAILEQLKEIGEREIEGRTKNVEGNTKDGGLASSSDIT